MAAEAVSESKYLASQIVDIELVNKAALGPGSRCAECQTQIYQPWISVTYGILLCIKCAGILIFLFNIKLSVLYSQCNKVYNAPIVQKISQTFGTVQ